MKERTMNDERLAALIRAAAPRREVPVGLETRIRAQVALRDRRRRERRAVAVMAGYCLGGAAAMYVVLLACLPAGGVLQALALLAGASTVLVIACGDRATEILRRL